MYSRDALAKALYDKVFNYIVNHINSVFQVDKPEEKLSIGLLDIYGFEIFEVGCLAITSISKLINWLAEQQLRAILHQLV
jgi:hypothetical protein